MTAFVKFTGINGRIEQALRYEEQRRQEAQAAREAAALAGSNVVLFDDLERPITPPTPAEQAAQAPGVSADVDDGYVDDAHSVDASQLHFPIFINPTQVRGFYPRRRGQTGTRIVFLNSAAELVQEDFETVAAMLAQ